MNKRLIWFIAGVALLCAAVIGGAYLYKTYQSKKTTSSLQNVSQKPTGDGVTPTNFASGSANLPALPASPSAKQVNEYVDEVRQNAQEGTDLSFTKCTATPEIFRVKTGSSVKLTNTDDKDIVIRISSKAIFTVPAKKTVTEKMSASAAIYKYNCSYAGEATLVQSGILEVTR